MIFEKLQEMVCEQMGLEKDEVKPESDIIKDLGCDSLDIVEMLMNVEAEWNIVVDDSEVAEMKTVADVVAFIKDKISA